MSARPSTAKPGAINAASQGAAHAPSAASTPATAARSPNTAPAARPASSSRPSSSNRTYTGMNEALSVPSPRRFCRTFGMRSAARQASASGPVPKWWAKTISRANPKIRLTRMPAATLEAAKGR